MAKETWQEKATKLNKKIFKLTEALETAQQDTVDNCIEIVQEHQFVAGEEEEFLFADLIDDIQERAKLNFKEEPVVLDLSFKDMVVSNIK